MATVNVAGIDLDLFDEGSGPPLLFLHGAEGFDPRRPFVKALTAKRRVIAPSHPGFGKSALPGWIDKVDDLAHVHGELLDTLGIDAVDAVGCSLGGWIAAEMATQEPRRFAKLVMVGPVGVKLGSPDQLDIPDIFAMSAADANKLMFHDPKSAPDLKTLPEDELAAFFRARETLALLVWEPWMHNPKLRHRLQRYKPPALFLRGASDGLVSDAYLKGYAALLPNAQAKTVPEAGHFPHLEAPDAFAKTVLEFLGA